ncbi:MAG: hypothetical protein ABIG69_02990 [Bacteroidota bacterium]
MKIKHYGKVVDGKLKLNSPSLFTTDWQQYKDKEIYLTVAEVKRERSNNQNRYFHAVIAVPMADKAGISINEMKRDLLIEAFGSIEVTRGKRTTTVPAQEHTSELDTSQFEHLCSTARRIASEFYNMYIKLPNEVEYER